MYGPGETDSSHSQVDYDAAGNQTKDLTASIGGGTRVYDAENRMTIAKDASNNQIAAYTYDADGRRVKRNVTGQTEVWQAYGLGGELLAEYAANASPASPQKEYGYRNGQLLMTAEASSTARTNYAAATNGAIASASSEYDAARGASAAINGDRKAQHWGSDAATGSGWLSATTGAAWLEVDFSNSKTIDEVDVVTVQDNYTSPSEPTETMTFSLYGLSGYNVQYWNGSAWTTVTGGSVTGNNKVWKKVTFSPVATTKIRVSTNASADGYSRIAELEAWGAAGQTQNVVWSNAVGVSSSGNSLTKTATTGWGNAGASSTQTLTSGDGYVEVTVGELGTSRIFGFSHTDTNQSWDTIDFGLHCADDAGNTIYVYESGTQRGTFGSYASGDKLRVAIVGGVVKYSRNGTVFYTSTVTPAYPVRVDTALYENGATIGSVVFGSGVAGSTSNINWLVTDQLGTPRMVFDQSGSLATTKRHDYAPFGEELLNGARPTTGGYASGDQIRQKFTQKQRDNETGLDYFLARYYSSTQGRFMSVDPEQAGANSYDPQSWHSYAYARNSPLTYSDPDGKSYRVCDQNGENCVDYTDKEFDKLRKGGPGDGYSFKDGNIYYNGELTGNYSSDCLACEQLINEMAARGPAVKRLTAGFVVVAVTLGATGGAGAYWLAPIMAPTVTTLSLSAAPLLPAVPSAIAKLQQLGISIEQANAIIQSPASQKLIDNDNGGNINVIQEVGGKLVRITTDPSGQRIISAGIVRANQITNGIANGRFIKK